MLPRRRKQQYAELHDLREQKARLKKIILTAMVMKEMEKPRETFVLARGDYRNQADKVEPGVPAVLPPLPRRTRRQTDLTWRAGLSIPAHPLTARVAVNRYWQMYFGNGTGEDRRGFRLAGRTADASRIARLAGDGIRPDGLGCQGDAAADRNVGHIPASVASNTRAAGKGSREPSAGPWSAFSTAGRDGSRQRPGGQRSAQ